MKITNYIIIIILLFSPIIAAAEGNQVSIIRDDETEKLLRDISEPIFSAAGLSPDAVEIIIVNDKSINAFVAGGQKVFIHTGLITESADLASLVGVIAHEAGHIKGAHLIQKNQSFQNASLGSIAGYVLGLGSVIAGAPAEAGIAISSASQNIATRNALSYSRDYENSADAVAVDIMSKIGINPEGLIGILKNIMQKQKLAGDIQDKYMLTHPISEDRINYIENYIKENPSSRVKTPNDLEERFQRVKAKIYGFLHEGRRVRNLYKGKKTDEANYAMAISNHQEARFDRSFSYLNKLLEKYPNDPYYNELKGQFLFESGKIQESIQQYRKVLELIPNSVLVKLKLANALLAKDSDANIKEAITNLKSIVAIEKDNITALNALGVAYGKKGKFDKSYLYLAEASYFRKNYDLAKQYANKAEQHMEKSSPDYIKVIELKNDIKRDEKEK